MITCGRILHQPRPGDFVRKGKKSRKVISVDGGTIEYQTETGKIKTCWISTWMEWCRVLDEAVPSLSDGEVR